MQCLKLFSIGLLTLTGSALWAQAPSPEANYLGFLTSVVSRSPQFVAQKQEFDAAVRQHRLGLAPDDPAVDLEYLFARERWFELVFSQQFDFPTLYHQRNKLSKLAISRSQKEYDLALYGLLAEASESYLALSCANKKISLFALRHQNLERMVELYKKGVEAGEYTRLELQSASMLLSESTVALAQATTERDQAAAALQQLNGGTSVPDAGYPVFRFSGSREEFVQAAMALDPALQAAALDTLIARRSVALSRQEWIPKLRIGYKVEMAGHTPTNGLVAGITLPLWQNSGSVRHAKLAAAAAATRKQATEEQTRVRLENLYDNYQTFSRSLSELDRNEDYVHLLHKALDAGEIDSLQFYLGMSEWYSLQESRLEVEHQAATAAAMMSLYLY